MEEKKRSFCAENWPTLVIIGGYFFIAGVFFGKQAARADQTDKTEMAKGFVWLTTGIVDLLIHLAIWRKRS